MEFIKKATNSNKRSEINVGEMCIKTSEGGRRKRSMYVYTRRRQGRG